ncbi:MAG: hypothetical protein ACM3PT_13150 [Deltaproteobacteria bacterium]
MRIFLFILLLFVLNSCCKDENCDASKLPDCIQQMIDVVGDAPPFNSVKRQKVDEEYHYWLNTGAMAWDGVEYIVNCDCDTVCEIGGFRPPQDCSKNFDFDKWEIVWEK